MVGPYRVTMFCVCLWHVFHVTGSRVSIVCDYMVRVSCDYTLCVTISCVTIWYVYGVSVSSVCLCRV